MAKSSVLLQTLEQLLQSQIDAIQMQTAEQKRIADSLVRIQGSLADLVSIIQKSTNPFKDEEQVNNFIKAESEKKPFVTLKLKREEKDPIYKKRPEIIQKFKEQVLEGIPEAMHNSVLHSAYKRMRDVYGVPVDTYRNEYFADTGKVTKSSLEVVHWLEFRNPAIRGLLHCCVQTVMSENFSDVKE